MPCYGENPEQISMELWDSYVRFEFEATAVNIKTWHSKQLNFMSDFYLLTHANTNK